MGSGSSIRLKVNYNTNLEHIPSDPSDPSDQQHSPHQAATIG